MEYPLAFKAVEVLGKAPTICFKIVPLDGEYKHGIEFIKGVQKMEQVSWVTLCSNGKEVAERRRNEGGELLFGEQF